MVYVLLGPPPLSQMVVFLLYRDLVSRSKSSVNRWMGRWGEKFVKHRIPSDLVLSILIVFGLEPRITVSWSPDSISLVSTTFTLIFKTFLLLVSVFETGLETG